MKCTKIFTILFLMIGMTVLGIPVVGAENIVNVSVTGNATVMESAMTEATHVETPAATLPENSGINGTGMWNATLNSSAPALNKTVQPYARQAGTAIPAAVTFTDSPTSIKMTLVSNTTTQSAGYTNTLPSSPLDISNYSNGYWSSAVAVTRDPLWYNNASSPFGSGAFWVSSQATTEGGNGDQWRLFKTDFDFPEGAILTSAQVWYTADNAAAVYLNDDEINSTGSVYGTPSGAYIFSKAYTVNFTPRAGSNTLKFVVRNWHHIAYNPTGLLYKVAIEYEPPQTEFTVYADGVSLYHGFNGNSDLFRAKTTSEEFYTNISGKQGDPYSSIHWEGIGNPVDDATGSRNWNINQDANSMANNADFAFHAGHGWKDGILFGTANPDYELFRTNNLSFGGNNGKAKWVALLSCDVLNQSTWTNWKTVFNGLHILMGYDTHGLEGANQGSQFAQRMTASGSYFYASSIRDSWRQMLQSTIQDPSYKGAFMWAEPCSNDFLPGFGGSCQDPVKDGNGEYTINWESFECYA